MEKAINYRQTMVILFMVLSCLCQAEAHDYMENLKALAKDGDVYAQLELGYAYKTGDDGFAKDENKSAEWFGKAAEQGNPYAQYEFGRHFQAIRNYQQALIWYKKSAEQAYPKAEYQIGNLYQCGLGVKQNYSEAVSWYEKSVRHNHAEAYYPMAQCYQRMGVKKYCVELTSCYRHYIDEIGHKRTERERLRTEYLILADKFETPLAKAARNGNTEAQLNYGWSAIQQLSYMETNVNYSRDDYTEICELGLFWIEESANGGNSEAMELLALCYERGLLNLERNNTEAVKWYLESGKYGSVDSYYILGDIYDMGLYGKDEIKVNLEQSLKYYNLAAQGGSINACGHLGDYYYNKRQYDKAKTWLKLCTDAYTEDAHHWFLYGMCLYREKKYEQAYSCFKKAQRLDKLLKYGDLGLGIFFYEGKACNIDYKKAFEHLKNVSESYLVGEEMVTARDYLAACYYNGRGTTENQELGKYWRDKAKEPQELYEKLFNK